MNYYTIYEKLLISLYFLCHLFLFILLQIYETKVSQVKIHKRDLT